MDIQQVTKEIEPRRDEELLEDKAALGNDPDYGVDTTKGGLANLKLDKNGLPLIPQPTDRSDDPLVSFSAVKPRYNIMVVCSSYITD